MASLPSDESTLASDERSDHELVHRCLQGEHHSFRWLYRRHQERVRSILHQMCGTTLLDDLVQEVFLRAWKGLPRFQRTAKFSTWLYRITWNVACDQRQSFAQGRSRLQIISSQTASHADGPDLMHLHYQDLVQRGLQQLTLDHRSVLVLHDLEEVPQKEVAEILGIPVGTVKSRLFHARAAMRQFLENQGVQL